MMIPRTPTTTVQTKAKRYRAPACEHVTNSPMSMKPPMAVTMPRARLPIFPIGSTLSSQPSCRGAGKRAPPRSARLPTADPAPGVGLGVGPDEVGLGVGPDEVGLGVGPDEVGLGVGPDAV